METAAPIGYLTVFALLSVYTWAAQNTSAGLSPSEKLSQEVRALAALVKDPSELETRQQKGRSVRDAISDLIVRQLVAMPSISGSELQGQIGRIVCVGHDGRCGTCDGPPYVFAADWGPKTDRRQVVVAYELNLGFMGPNGSHAIIENYVWQNHKTVRTSRGGHELDGRQVKFQLSAWYPAAEQYWIIGSGAPYGWSGRAFSGRALLYRVGTDGVLSVWGTQTLPNLNVQRNELGWEVTYADRNRFYNNLPAPYVLDVYRFDYDKRSYERVIHHRY